MPLNVRKPMSLLAAAAALQRRSKNQLLECSMLAWMRFVRSCQQERRLAQFPGYAAWKRRTNVKIPNRRVQSPETKVQSKPCEDSFSLQLTNKLLLNFASCRLKGETSPPPVINFDSI